MHDFIPSESFATYIMRIIDAVLHAIGVSDTSDVGMWVYLAAIILVAIAAGLVVQWLITLIVRRFLVVRFSAFSAELAKNHVLKRCGRVIPPLVLLSLIPFVLDSQRPITRVVVIVTTAYTVLTIVVAVNSVMQLVWNRYNTRHNDKNLPLRGVLDISQGVMWVMAVILIVSMLVHKSPIALLTGLGAFAAVLMLIFKDSILGLVAGVQLSENDMLRVGDWISVPGTEINGIVIDVSLVVVKVRNFNNTVAMLPPYSLVSNHFINWRYMKEGGSRQIEMSVPIDINTVAPMTDDQLHAIQAKVPLLKNFIDVKIHQRDQGDIRNVFNSEAGADGTIDTNLGLLRAYINLYLGQHPYIYKEKMRMVRLLQPTSTGYPLQVFCYVTTSLWPAYESIKADIFEHITAIAPTFGLCIFEQPSARSVFGIGVNPRPDVPYDGSAPVESPTPNPATNEKVGITQ